MHIDFCKIIFAYIEHILRRYSICVVKYIDLFSDIKLTFISDIKLTCSWFITHFIYYWIQFEVVRSNTEGFPGGTVVENLPANAEDTGLSPGLGRSHMPRSN